MPCLCVDCERLIYCRTSFKKQIIGHSNGLPPSFLYGKLDECRSYSLNVLSGLKAVLGVVHQQPYYKLQVDCLEHMRPHQVAKENDKVRQMQNWEQQMPVSERLTTHPKKFPDLLCALQNNWDGYLGLIFSDKYKIELSSQGSSPIHIHRYGSLAKARQFGAEEIALMTKSELI